MKRRGAQEILRNHSWLTVGAGTDRYDSTFFIARHSSVHSCTSESSRLQSCGGLVVSLSALTLQNMLAYMPRIWESWSTDSICDLVEVLRIRHKVHISR